MPSYHWGSCPWRRIRVRGTTNLSCAGCTNPQDTSTGTGSTGDYDAIDRIRTIPHRRCGRLRAHRPLACKVPCFHGSLSPMYRFGDKLPIPLPEAMFKNRGFPTFPLGGYLRDARIPINSHANRGRTDTNHKNPPFLPHRSPIASHRPTTPPIPRPPLALVDGRKLAQTASGKQKTGAEAPVCSCERRELNPHEHSLTAT